MSGFWIWLRVVIFYVCSLFRYFFVACCWIGERRVYVAVCVHADFFMGKFLMVVCTSILYSLSNRYSVRDTGDLTHAWYFKCGRW